jgi:predicted RNase H-like HicB family nuclease
VRYPIAIETDDKKHAYGVVVPDMPGCFSAGDTLDEAITNAREAILLHLEGLLEDQEAPPKPSPIAVFQRNRDYRGWTWALIDVDLSELGDKAARINVLLPQRVLRAIDLHARKSGETRSGFLARAAIEAMRESAATPTGARAAK